MEDTLGESKAQFKCLDFSVLILVLMEDTLGEGNNPLLAGSFVKS